jgi:hypothetical protein
MALGEALCQLAVQHSRIVGSPGPSHHAELIDELQTRASHLALAVSKAEEKLEDNQQQRQDSQGFRGTLSGPLYQMLSPLYFILSQR